MIDLNTFNKLKAKTSDRDTQESLLNLMATPDPAANDALIFLDSLDKITTIYLKEDSIGIYGIIDNLYFYKEFEHCG